jgi:hypothetical protein
MLSQELHVLNRARKRSSEKTLWIRRVSERKSQITKETEEDLEKAG